MMTNIQPYINKGSTIVLETAGYSGLGYLCARLFTAVNPLAGGVFAAAASLVFRIVNPIFGSIFNQKESNSASRELGGIFTIATTFIIAKTLTELAGFSISYSACSVVAVSMFVLVALTSR